MWNSSAISQFPSTSLTGSLPLGCMADPLTACGKIIDCNRLSGVHLLTEEDHVQLWRSLLLSQGGLTPLCGHFNEDIWISMFGADTIAAENAIGSRLTAMVVDAVTPCVGAPCCHRWVWQTLMKWPVLLQCTVCWAVLTSSLVLSSTTPWALARGFMWGAQGGLLNSLDKRVSYRSAGDLLALLLCCFLGTAL